MFLLAGCVCCLCACAPLHASQVQVRNAFVASSASECLNDLGSVGLLILLFAASVSECLNDLGFVGLPTGRMRGLFGCSSRVVFLFAGCVCCRGARALLHALQVRNAGVAFVFFFAQRFQLLTLLLSSV